MCFICEGLIFIMRTMCATLPYLQALQPPLEALHGLAQLVYGLAGVPRQVAHRVLAILLASGTLTPRFTLRLVRSSFAARQLGVKLLDSALLAHDGLLLLKDSFPELDDCVPKLILHGAARDSVASRTVSAARLRARGNGVTHKAATCGVLCPHHAPAHQVH